MVNLKGRPRQDMNAFLDRIIINPTTQCWEWQGAKDRDGYGFISYKSKIKLVHRISYMYHNDVPEEHIKGKVVMHKCDNPSCANPDHLNLGTVKDNIHDCIKKGRRASTKGELNANAKITDYQAKKIRELSQLGLSKEELAKMFNISRRSIYNIVNNVTWTHVSSE